MTVTGSQTLSADQPRTPAKLGTTKMTTINFGIEVDSRARPPLCGQRVNTRKHAEYRALCVQGLEVQVLTLVVGEMKTPKTSAARKPARKPMNRTGTPAVHSKFHRSKVVAGLRLLPGMSSNEMGQWGRIMRDVLDRITEHVGGESEITETQRWMARRCACLEAELVFMEEKLARKRMNGEEPTETDLQLYGRLASHQRRIADALGWKRVMKDITPTNPLEYAKQKYGETS
jgi:hypothetical protein